MLTQVLLVGLCVFICYGVCFLTSQSMTDRPLVVGAVAGLLYGDVATGVMIGAALEAVFMGAVNVGGVISADTVSATALAAAFAIFSGVSQDAAIALAIPIGTLAAMVVLFLKNVFVNIFTPFVSRAAAEGSFSGITCIHFVAWVVYFGIIAILSAACFAIGSGPVEQFVNNLPPSVMAGLNCAAGLLPAVGFAMLMKLIWDKKLAVFYFLGFVLAIYLNLPAVAIAAIGIIIAVIIALQDKDAADASLAEPIMSATTSKQQEEEEFFA